MIIIGNREHLKVHLIRLFKWKLTENKCKICFKNQNPSLWTMGSRVFVLRLYWSRNLKYGNVYVARQQKNDFNLDGPAKRILRTSLGNCGGVLNTKKNVLVYRQQASLSYSSPSWESHELNFITVNSHRNGKLIDQSDFFIIVENIAAKVTSLLLSQHWTPR